MSVLLQHIFMVADLNIQRSDSDSAQRERESHDYQFLEIILVTHHNFKCEAAAWRRVYVLFQHAGLTEYEGRSQNHSKLQPN